VGWEGADLIFRPFVGWMANITFHSLVGCKVI
jgi:hypothetical protein